MDEILASIRKIIENNEALPDLAADGGEDDEGFDITTDSQPTLLDHPAVVEQFHAEEQRAAVVQPLPRSEPQPALSLADVAARVRAASERHVAANRDTASRDAIEREPVAIEREPVAVEPVQREESPLVTARMAANAGRVEPTEKIEPTPLKIEPAPLGIEAAPQTVEAIEPVSRDIAALVSPAVGERVAQSFGALAEAIDAGPRRSFDEIAEDMLRPMLQEWLDDNLPTLVERLVREEIERVARGPRR
ncbi:UNVERIFIED_ORG: PopZ family protein [Roseateles sp. XES5]|nr:PopZ family protein [Roseateles sp. XES5]